MPKELDMKLGNPGNGPGKCDVLVGHHPKGLKRWCQKCKKTLATGFYTVVVTVTYPEKTFNYVLGKLPHETCCGQDTMAFHLFNLEGEAQEEATKAAAELNRTLDTSGLRLLTVTQVIKGCDLN